MHQRRTAEVPSTRFEWCGMVRNTVGTPLITGIVRRSRPGVASRSAPEFTDNCRKGLSVVHRPEKARRDSPAVCRRTVSGFQMPGGSGECAVSFAGQWVRPTGVGRRDAVLTGAKRHCNTRQSVRQAGAVSAAAVRPRRLERHRFISRWYAAGVRQAFRPGGSAGRARPRAAAQQNHHGR